MLDFLKIAKRIVAAYPLGKGAMILKLDRKTKQWRLSSSENYFFEGSESIFDTIAKISSAVSNPAETTFLLILPRSYYFFARTTYPKHLEESIEKIVEYDREESIFIKNGSLYLLGDLLRGEESLTATLFWLKSSIYEKIIQTASAQKFFRFVVVPDGLVLSRAHKVLFADPVEDLEKSLWVISAISHEKIQLLHMARHMLTESILMDLDRWFHHPLVSAKLNRAVKVLFLKSYIGDPARNFLWEENLANNLKSLVKNGDVREAGLEECVKEGVLNLLTASRLKGFDSQVWVNLPRIPGWSYGIILAVLCYAVFAILLTFHTGYLEKNLKILIRERSSLEEQWKPIESQIKLVEQIEQDKKVLGELTEQNIPMKELLELLSALTPKDTWINNFIITQKEKMILRGESKSAVQYMGELSKVGGFKDVRFISPVSKKAGEDKEFFNIEISVDWVAFKKAIKEGK